MKEYNEMIKRYIHKNKLNRWEFILVESFI
jgi:hypothetical protein